MTHWSTRGLPTALLALVAVAPIACGGGDSGSDTNSGDAVELDTTPGDSTGDTNVPCNLALGEPCYLDEQCESGLCLVSEYAPFGMCTVECVDDANFCQTADGTTIDGFWCIEFPNEFNVLSPASIGPFCVPMCDTLADCESISSAYELCERPMYRGNPLYGDAELNRAVCQAPSTAGKQPVDPFSCAEWESSATGFNSEKNLCANYCQFLDDCQYYSAGHNLDCCAYYCFLEMVPQGEINGPFKDLVTNHIQWFSASAGTAQQCLGEDKYGVPPKPDDAAPPDPAGQCQQ